MVDQYSVWCGFRRVFSCFFDLRRLGDGFAVPVVGDGGNSLHLYSECIGGLGCGDPVSSVGRVEVRADLLAGFDSGRIPWAVFWFRGMVFDDVGPDGVLYRRIYCQRVPYGRSAYYQPCSIR